MEAMQPAFHGHPRAICVFALSRMIAVMLGPAMPETREHMLVELPLSIRAILVEMDRMIAAGRDAMTALFLERERALSSVCPAYALGVDIGTHGYIAGLDKSGGLLWLQAMPTTRETSGRNAINAPLLSGVLAAAHCSVAFVEFVAARPTNSRVGAFGFGRNRGVVEGVCGALSIPIIWVAPSTWKRAANIPAGREHKDLCRTRAIQKWPSFAEFFRRKSDVDAAEDVALGSADLPDTPLLERAEACGGSAAH